MAADFTSEFQLRVLVWMCCDPDECKYWFPYLDPSLFEFDSLRWLSEIIKSSYETYKKPPTRMQIESDLTLTDTIFEGQDLVMYMSFLEMMDEGFEELEYIKDIFPQFVRSRKLRQMLFENEEMLDGGDWGGLRYTLKLNEPVLNPKLSDISDVFSIQIFEELFNRGEEIPSGIPLIDDRMGGLHKKEMMLILADTNVGKSLLMTYMGGRALEAGKKVLHISLEMSVARIMVRYAATLDPNMSITVNEISSLRNPEKLIYHMAWLKDHYDKQLYLCELPTGLGSIQDIERLIDEAEPDIVILDYLDLIKPITTRDSKRFEVAEIAMVTRGMAVQGNFHILSASQTNRAGHNTRIVDVNLSAEDYDKMRTSDDVIGMGQSRYDVQRQEVVLYVAKARNSEKGLAHRYHINHPHLRYVFRSTEVVENRDTANGRGSASGRRETPNY